MILHDKLNFNISGSGATKVFLLIECYVLAPPKGIHAVHFDVAISMFEKEMAEAPSLLGFKH